MTIGSRQRSEIELEFTQGVRVGMAREEQIRCTNIGHRVSAEGSILTKRAKVS